MIFTGLRTIAQPGTKTLINDGWAFTKDTLAGKWEKINLPHTWNNKDVMDDEPGYYRGTGWYRRKLIIRPSDKNKEIFLRFEGANQFTEVYVNGKKAGSHTGGYTAFQFSITPFLLFNGNNEVLVRVDNRFDSLVPPLTADFTFFGGIYRDVYLVTVGAVHFSMDSYGSNGIRIITPVVNKDESTVNVKAIIANRTGAIKNIFVSCTIRDKENRIIQYKKRVIEAGNEYKITIVIDKIRQPHLWSPEDPYLYHLTTEIREESSGELLDAVTEPLGFRWFRFDADSGFYLNGKPLKLIGASRHQDRPGMGNAVPDKLAYEDLLLLKKMGGNFLRVAHYPQDPSVIEACDKLGLLASVEIPVVNEITESEIFYRNCDEMLLEMIRQNHNHPSVVIWCYMNEVLLRPHFNDDKPRQKIYFSNVAKLAKRLDSICRQEDPSRYTMIAHHGDFDRYHSNGLTEIPMIVGWNLYSGWYGGQFENFASFLDKHHQLLPNKPVVVSEYGADADPRIRSFAPVKFDKSVEYAMRFHQYYLQEILKRPFVAGGMIWNLADFNSETREETMPHINNKGMLMWDRTPKDLYYFYQANLSKIPFIAITSSYWIYRTGIADSGTTICHQPIQVATNLDSTELFVNGRSMGWKLSIQGLCEWSVPLVNGMNSFEAKGSMKGRSYRDISFIRFKLQPYKLSDELPRFEKINILLGATRYFVDKNKQVWQPAQAYRQDSWGYIGGQPFKLPGNTRLPYGTDKNIIGTDEDPIYQTQQVGITGFRFDVPDGEYEITLHFAEIQGIESRSLIYNLSDSARKAQTVRRKFDIYLNEDLILKDVEPGKDGTAKPVIKTFLSRTSHAQGINIVFKPVEGEVVLNAIQLKRVK